MLKYSVFYSLGTPDTQKSTNIVMFDIIITPVDQDDKNYSPINILLYLYYQTIKDLLDIFKRTLFIRNLLSVFYLVETKK